MPSVCTHSKTSDIFIRAAARFFPRRLADRKPRPCLLHHRRPNKRARRCLLSARIRKRATYLFERRLDSFLFGSRIENRGRAFFIIADQIRERGDAFCLHAFENERHIYSSGGSILSSSARGSKTAAVPSSSSPTK